MIKIQSQILLKIGCWLSVYRISRSCDTSTDRSNVVVVIFCYVINIRIRFTGKFLLSFLVSYCLLKIISFQFALMETVTTAILDKFPNLRQFKVWIVLFVAIFGYIGGLIFTTNVSLLLLEFSRNLLIEKLIKLINRVECIGFN